MYKLFILLFLVSCSHKKQTLTAPVMYPDHKGAELVVQMGEKYYENIVFMFSVELEYQGFYLKALEGYYFLNKRYPHDAFLVKKIKFIECSVYLDLC